ncbi:MAG: hypothetical protein ACREB9_00155 [Thermoplasmata archaeon]
MPNAELHAAINRLVLGSDGREVQKLLDRTAHVHGPSHRKDPEHSMENLLVELALANQLTPENVLAGQLHIVVDEAWSGYWSSNREPSRRKEPIKRLVQADLADMLDPRRKRR